MFSGGSFVGFDGFGEFGGGLFFGSRRHEVSGQSKAQCVGIVIGGGFLRRVDDIFDACDGISRSHACKAILGDGRVWDREYGVWDIGLFVGSMGGK
jgi:hypothetical protein